MAAWWLLADAFPLSHGEQLPDPNLTFALRELSISAGKHQLNSPKAKRRYTARPRRAHAQPALPQIAGLVNA